MAEQHLDTRQVCRARLLHKCQPRRWEDHACSGGHGTEFWCPQRGSGADPWPVPDERRRCCWGRKAVGAFHNNKVTVGKNTPGAWPAGARNRAGRRDNHQAGKLRQITGPWGPGQGVPVEPGSPATSCGLLHAPHRALLCEGVVKGQVETWPPRQP